MKSRPRVLYSSLVTVMVSPLLKWRGLKSLPSDLLLAHDMFRPHLQSTVHCFPRRDTRVDMTGLFTISLYLDLELRSGTKASE